MKDEESVDSEPPFSGRDWHEALSHPLRKVSTEAIEAAISDSLSELVGSRMHARIGAIDFGYKTNQLPSRVAYIEVRVEKKK